MDEVNRKNGADDYGVTSNATTNDLMMSRVDHSGSSGSSQGLQTQVEPSRDPHITAIHSIFKCSFRI